MTLNKKALLLSVCVLSVMGTQAFADRADRAKRAHERQLASYAHSIIWVHQKITTWIGGASYEREMGDDPDKPRRNPGTEPLNDWADGVPLDKIYNLHASRIYPGIKARYCDDTLLVYLDDPAPKGVGPDNLRNIQTGWTESYLRKNGTSGPGQPPAPLQWMEDNIIESSFQYADPILEVPACMLDTPLPSGRPVKIERVIDLSKQFFEKTVIDRRTDACPAGKHGKNGIYMRREGTQKYNKFLEPVGAPVWGAWAEFTNYCKDDYARDFTFKTSCSYTTKKGTTWQGSVYWTQTKNVSADGVSMSAPEFKSSNCPDIRDGVVKAELPAPIVNTVNTTENKSQSCPAGYTGSISLRRTKTVRTTTFVWKQDPVVATSYSNWAQTSNTCTQPLVCSTWEGSSEEGFKHCTCRRGGEVVSSSRGACGSGGGSSGGGGDHDGQGGGDTDADHDGRSRQDGDTNDHEGPSNGDAASGGDRSHNP
ncbi:hypothetical protein [Kiloniella sp.]|uniref:hypothetical protein n=1 Tax=Kiloniella sp. TaxID=1938587 RepID=UPI003B0270A7